VTGAWRFELQGHTVEVERTHGFVAIDGRVYVSNAVKGLGDVEELAGKPLRLIARLIASQEGILEGDNRPVQATQQKVPPRDQQESPPSDPPPEEPPPPARRPQTAPRPSAHSTRGTPDTRTHPAQPPPPLPAELPNDSSRPSGSPSDSAARSPGPRKRRRPSRAPEPETEAGTPAVSEGSGRGVRHQNLKTVRQLVEESKAAAGGHPPAFTEGGLRWCYVARRWPGSLHWSCPVSVAVCADRRRSGV
jgi:hypothetical protein